MNVVIVNEELAVRELMRLVLEEGGHRVFDAGAAPRTPLPAAPPPVGLVICVLPGRNKTARDAAAEYRREFPGAKLVALVWPPGASPVDLAPLARSLGADAALARPFSWQDVLAAVRRAQEGW